MKKFLLKLLMGASLTTSVFIFQACYGPAIPDADIPRDQTQLQEAIPENPEVLEDEEIEAESEEEATPESL
ncbi:MAG: hypothetical protein J5907_03210 [Bacteroidales bacterium]|nr:hypothetical protein [Bacteroidales bacterium]